MYESFHEIEDPNHARKYYNEVKMKYNDWKDFLHDVNEEGNTPLMEYINKIIAGDRRKCMIDMVVWICKQGVDTNNGDEYSTPLQCIVEHCYRMKESNEELTWVWKKVIDTLLSHSANDKLLIEVIDPYSFEIVKKSCKEIISEVFNGKKRKRNISD